MNLFTEWDTPGKYLDADKSFHPQYQFDDMDTTDVDEDNKRDDTVREWALSFQNFV